VAGSAVKTYLPGEENSSWEQTPDAPDSSGKKKKFIYELLPGSKHSGSGKTQKNEKKKDQDFESFKDEDFDDF
jgi:hypothetical protein